MPTGTRVWNLTHDFNQIGAIGFLPVVLSSAPGGPTVGQMFTDSTTGRIKMWTGSAWIFMDQFGAELSANKGVASGYASLDGSTKVPYAQLPTGTGASQVMPGSTTLDAVTAPASNVNLNNKNLTNVADPSGDQHAVNRRFLYATTLNQLASSAGDYDMGSHKITGLAAPVSANDAVRLIDLQNAQAGIDLKPSVRLATASNVNTGTGLANGQTIDGVTIATGDRILLMGQSTASQNGVYIAPASGLASRATDSINPNSMWFVEEGTANHDTAWMVTNDGAIVLGTTALTIAQFGSGSLTYTGTANRITVTGTVIDIASNYAGQSSIVTLGTITTGVWNGTAVDVAHGGTGATTAAAALAALGGAASSVVGGVAIPALTAGSEATVTHGLGRKDVHVVIRRVSDDVREEFEIRPLSTTTFGVTSAIAKSSGTYYAVVIG